MRIPEDLIGVPLIIYYEDMQWNDGVIYRAQKPDGMYKVRTNRMKRIKISDQNFEALEITTVDDIVLVIPIDHSDLNFNVEMSRISDNYINRIRHFIYISATSLSQIGSLRLVQDDNHAVFLEGETLYGYSQIPVRIDDYGRVVLEAGVSAIYLNLRGFSDSCC